jgi:hypothetical protein
VTRRCWRWLSVGTITAYHPDGDRMIVLVLGGALLALFFGAALLALFVQAIRLLARIGFAILIGAGLGVTAGAIAGANEGDGTALGFGIGLLGFATALAVLTARRKVHAPLEPFNGAAAQPALNSPQSYAVPVAGLPLIEPALLARLNAVTREVHDAAAANPLDVDLLDWAGVLGRVPELINETDALHRVAAVAEQAVLRLQLAEDIREIVTEAERRLTATRRERHTILRRWVAIRTGRA